MQADFSTKHTAKVKRSQYIAQHLYKQTSKSNCSTCSSLTSYLIQPRSSKVFTKKDKKGFIFFGQIPIKKAHCGTEPACRLIPLVSYAVAVWPKPLQHYTTVQRLLYTVCGTLVYTVHKQHTVSRLQIPLDRRTVKSIFHCSKQGSAAETLLL